MDEDKSATNNFYEGGKFGWPEAFAFASFMALLGFVAWLVLR